MKKLGTLLLLLVFTLVMSQSALAFFSALPETSEELSNWYGYRDYTGNGFDCSVYFSVYDRGTGGTSEFEDAGYVAPEDGQFVYVYQVVNFGGDIGEFAVFALGEDIDMDGISEDNISAERDPYQAEGDDVTGNPTNSEWVDESKEVKWTFTGDSAIGANEHSWFLIFTSDFGPIKGDFTVAERPASQGDLPTSGSEVPEPATAIILSSGLYIVRRLRRKNG